MQITLPEDLKNQAEQEIASGRYANFDDLIQQALKMLIEERQSTQRRIDALRRVAEAVDREGLYERTLVPE